jgi:hypothetical protein
MIINLEGDRQMMRFQNDSMLFDGAEVARILLDHYEIETPEDADLTISLTSGDTLQAFPLDDACIVIRQSTEEHCDPDVIPFAA